MLAYHLTIVLTDAVPVLLGLKEDILILVAGVAIGAVVNYWLFVRRHSSVKEQLTADNPQPTNPKVETEEQLLFLQILIDAIPVPIFYKNAEGIYMGCNKAFEAYIGLTRSQLVGKSVYDIAPKSLADSYYEADRALLERGGLQTYESCVAYADGTRHDVIFNKATFLDSKDRLGGLVGTLLDITELKQAEAEKTRLIISLQESEERFRRLAEATYEGISILDRGTILDANQALSRMFGYELSEVIGSNAIEYFAPEYRELVKENILSGYDKPYEAIGLRKDGSRFPVELQGKAIPYEGGSVRVSALRDISDRLRSQAALRESEKRFHIIFEAAAIGICLARRDGHLLESNPALQQMLGYTGEELCSMFFTEFTHPEDLQADQQFYQDMIAGQREYYQMEKRYICKDKRVIWGRWTVSAVRDAEGLPQFAIGMVEDITEHKRTQEMRQKSEEQLRAIVEGIPVPVLISRLSDGEVLYANSQLGPTFGLSSQELIGRSTPDFYYDRADGELLHSALQSQGYLHNYEVRVKKADGTPFWVVLSGASVEFNAQQAVLYTLYDITYRVQMEAMLRSRSRLSSLSAMVGVALSQGGTVTEILHRCTEAMQQQLDAAFVGIWTFNEGANLLELSGYAGEQPDTVEFGERVPLGFSFIGFIAQNRQPYVTGGKGQAVKSKEQGSQSGVPPLLSSVSSSEEKSGLSSSGEAIALAGYPLILEQRLVGVMALLGRQNFTEEVQNLLGWVANSIAVAIDRVKAREALYYRREALLFRLANQIRNSLDLDTILETAVYEIKSLLQIDRCHFLWCLPQSTQSSITVSHEARQKSLPSLLGDYTDDSIASLSDKIQRLQTIRIDDVKQLEPTQQRLLSQLGIASQLLLPLETRAGQFGAVVCSHCSTRTWSASEIELLRAVTDQLAIAIDQAELYARARSSALSAQTQAQQLEVALRELQQTQEQLMQTEKMSSLGQLVAGIAHEINNPVTFITGNLIHVHNYAQDLLTLVNLYEQELPNPSPTLREQIENIDLEFLNDDLPKLLSSMEAGAQRIRKIVLSLRNFSRLDEADMKQVDIHEGIDSTLLILQHRLNGSAGQPIIEVVKEYGKLPLVECYAGQLNQVFINLLTNAIDAIERNDKTAPPGCIKIRTSLRHGEAEKSAMPDAVSTKPHGQVVLIQIADNGSGMTEDTKARLFDPFFTTKPVGAGTGLGLSISYQIVVKQHGGNLKYVSELGLGTEFSIEIPARQIK